MFLTICLSRCIFISYSSRVQDEFDVDDHSYQQKQHSASLREEEIYTLKYELISSLGRDFLSRLDVQVSIQVGC